MAENDRGSTKERRSEERQGSELAQSRSSSQLSRRGGFDPFALLLALACYYQSIFNDLYLYVFRFEPG